MAKILACSANGYGTGLMMKMTLDKVIDICGFKLEDAAFNSIMEGRKIASQYDIVLCPIDYVDMFESAASKEALDALNALEEVSRVRVVK